MILAKEMRETEFWIIIDQTISKVQAAQSEGLRAALAKLGPQEIAAFDATYRAMLDRAYRWDLWGAAYVINDGCSDDGFDYFCDWLISHGRKVFEAALADPESLSEVEDLEDIRFEDFRYVAQEVFEQSTGQELDATPSERSDPVGKPFDEETVYDLYPNLVRALDVRAGREPMPVEDQQPLPKKPVFSAEYKREFDAILSGLVGQPITRCWVDQETGFFRPNSNIALFFNLGRQRLQAKAWTLELRDGQVLSVFNFVRERVPSHDLFAGLREQAYTDLQISEATRNLFPTSKVNRIKLSSAERVGDHSVRLRFADMPLCRALTLHGFDSGRSGDTYGVLLKQGDETLCLSPLGVEMQVHNHRWAEPPKRGLKRVY